MVPASGAVDAGAPATGTPTRAPDTGALPNRPSIPQNTGRILAEGNQPPASPPLGAFAVSVPAVSDRCTQLTAGGGRHPKRQRIRRSAFPGNAAPALRIADRRPHS